MKDVKEYLCNELQTLDNNSYIKASLIALCERIEELID